MSIGRNDPCPCGSGRKYKQCCLRAPVGPRLNTASTHFKEAVALEALGRLGLAADHYRAALALRSDFLEAQVNLGNVLRRQGHAEQALACFRRALELRPDLPELNLNLALSLQVLGRFDEAIERYRAALPLRGRDIQVLNNLGLALSDAGRHEEAVATFRAALEIDPNWAPLHLSYGRTLGAQSRTAEAIASCRRAVALDPSLAKAHSGLLLALLYSDTESPAEIWREHRRFADRFETPLQPGDAARANVADPERRLRVGYISPDFRAHSVAYFIEPVLHRHDRSQFEVHCYYTATPEDAFTLRIREAADHWVPCATFSEQQLADRIRADGIDLLVDLSGHTAGNRLLVFARGPAPVQLSWIGYPLGTGLRGIDYRLTDHLASPPEADSGSLGAVDAEALFRLPGVFCCYRPPLIAPDPEPRDASTADGITLGSFNNAAKISDSIVRLWSRLLLKRPSISLLLKDASYAERESRDRTIARFAAQGVNKEQLTLLARVTSDAGHLSLYRRVDIAVDTFPYCGVTTTCEALWMGVPVVSLVGETFRSRMGLTLLSAVGHPEWAVTSEEDYIERVLALAGDPAQRAALRQGLRASMRASPLLDEAGVTREVEAAYRTMWRRWCHRNGIEGKSRLSPVHRAQDVRIG